MVRTKGIYTYQTHACTEVSGQVAEWWRGICKWYGVVGLWGKVWSQDMNARVGVDGTLQDCTSHLFSRYKNDWSELNNKQWDLNTQGLSKGQRRIKNPVRETWSYVKKYLLFIWSNRYFPEFLRSVQVIGSIKMKKKIKINHNTYQCIPTTVYFWALQYIFDLCVHWSTV